MENKFFKIITHVGFDTISYEVVKVLKVNRVTNTVHTVNKNGMERKTKLELFENKIKCEVEEF